MMTDFNLYGALRAAFPSDLNAVAIETIGTDGGQCVTWQELDQASARMANLLQSLDLPAASRIASNSHFDFLMGSEAGLRSRNFQTWSYPSQMEPDCLGQTGG